MAELRKFVSPEIIFGAGARKLVAQYTANLGVRKPLVVSDAGVNNVGWSRDVLSTLEAAGIEYSYFDGVSPNPRAEEVMIGADIYRRENCDGIVCVGGGSPMDCAKGIGIVVSNRDHIVAFEGVDMVEHPVPPLIFIPTTAGTSSDVSQFAIISDQAEKVKIAIVSKKIVPDVALIDCETTLTMDPYLTACTGMDAMVHGVEAFVSNASSMMTDIHALKGIELVYQNLYQVMQSPNDVELREKMMLGSLEAGLAFSNAILGAVHAMAHSLGGLLDIPHGEANSILLEHVVAYNFDAAPERFKKIAEIFQIDCRGMSQQEVKQRLIQAIVDYKKSVGITKRLRDVGVKTADIAPLAKKAAKDACLVTNPRTATEEDVKVIYEEAI